MQNQRSYTLPGGVGVTRTQPACGAVLSGIDLAEPIGTDQAESIRRALFAHGVIFFTGQEHIGFDEHMALARVFGTPVCDGPDPERPEITPVRARAGSRDGTAASWHSDGIYQSAPEAASILRAIEPCTFGGDTCFSSGVAAYAGLPQELQRRIAPLRFVTSLAATIPKDYPHFGSPDKWAELNAKYPPITQPMVIVHPVTGARALYTNTTWAHGIVGMDDDEAMALIAHLSSEFGRPEYQTRWQWRKGAIAIWDNRLVHHYGVPDQTTDRYLERITVEGAPMISIAEWEQRPAARSEEEMA